MNLRDAAQQALEALETLAHTKAPSVYNSARDALRAALAEPQPQPEPVAWRFRMSEVLPWSLSDDGYYVSCKKDVRYIVEPLYTSPPHHQPLPETLKRGCRVCGIGADGKAYGYVCSRSDCPTKITCGGAT